MVRVQQRLGVSERRACEVLGQARSTQRRSRKRGADEAALRADVVKVAVRFGRYGYRMVTGMLRAEGWVVNHKRVERIWREEGLKVPKKQPKRGRLWLTDGSCIRLRPLYRHHVWAYDFVADRTHDGRPLKMLTVLDEYSRECLAIVVARRLRADDVLQTLSELFVEHGPPANLRSDNGPEFTAKVVREWLERVEVKTLYIEPGSPWENGYNESFNGTLGEASAVGSPLRPASSVSPRSRPYLRTSCPIDSTSSQRSRACGSPHGSSLQRPLPAESR